MLAYQQFEFGRVTNGFQHPGSPSSRVTLAPCFRTGINLSISPRRRAMFLYNIWHYQIYHHSQLEDEDIRRIVLKAVYKYVETKRHSEHT
jgi:hypothetical protein